MDKDMNSKSSAREHALANEKIEKLIIKFGVPSIISFVVSALYNIVDQIFVGQGMGILGNAATNVAFPMTIMSTALALLLGLGTASNFNLSLGAGNREKAGHFAGSGVFLLAACGISLGVLLTVFLRPLMYAFGTTENVLPYAQTYSSIIALGIPLVTFSTGASHIIRSDGSPGYSMVCITTGAILNTILDPLFIFVFHWGIAGAAWATVIGQAVSAVQAALYFLRFKNMKIGKEYLRPRMQYVKPILSLGSAGCFNQLSMAAVQIAMNNTLTYYGALSQYGSDIPLACVGVISKVNTIIMGITIGIAHGCQPIHGFNYGAKNYGRVRETYIKGFIAATTVSILAFLAFQLFPREIVSIFGQGTEMYFRFSERYFRIFMLLTFINGAYPVTANFLTSIGKAKVGFMISLTRQILFLLPLIIIFPIFMGIDGVMYAGPVADGFAAVLAGAFMLRELRWLTNAHNEQLRIKGLADKKQLAAEKT